MNCQVYAEYCEDGYSVNDGFRNFLIIMGITIIQLIRDLFTRVDPLSVAKADRRTTLKLIVVTVLTIFSCVITQNFYEISSNFH